jgi:FMN phosphatase YigB (HAD superfamily)
MGKVHRVSSLGKTWILDLDGTLVKHNGYKIDGEDSWLDGALSFLRGIPQGDKIVFLTSRTDAERELTESFLRKYDIRYDDILYNAPYGERILVNDKKPSGLETAIAINTERDEVMEDKFFIDETL